MATSKGNEQMARALVRLNAHVLGGALALVFGLGLFVATLALVVQGGPAQGQMLALLAHFFPGYSVSIPGAIAGGIWGGLAGFFSGYIVGRAYGPWLLRGAARAMDDQADAGRLDPLVLELRPLPFAVVSGALLAAALLFATNWVYVRYGGHASPHLDLLANYLPGYSSNPLGSVIGAFWIFAWGFLAAFAIAWIYDRVVAARSAGRAH